MKMRAQIKRLRSDLAQARGKSMDISIMDTGTGMIGKHMRLYRLGGLAKNKSRMIFGFLTSKSRPQKNHAGAPDRPHSLIKSRSGRRIQTAIFGPYTRSHFIVNPIMEESTSRF